MIRRHSEEEIKNRLFRGKLVILTGARQTGKTTLLKSIHAGMGEESLFLNCDELSVREMLSVRSASELRLIAGNKKLIIIDEAQRVPELGITLKLFADEIKEVQVIASGSSALGLSDTIFEPLTGRKFEITLPPVTIKEVLEYTGYAGTRSTLENYVIYGMYPAVITEQFDKRGLLRELSSSYLYKDVLMFRDLRRSEVIEKLLQLLAYQTGSLVSLNELASKLGIDIGTVSRYIDLMEKSFIIFRLPPFKRNLRNEITKMRKIYFYDTGIRNSVISDFSPLNQRQDAGALWENFVISERIKFLMNKSDRPNLYFWRTQQGQETDLVEEIDGRLSGYEIKLSEKSAGRFPVTFLNTYKDATADFITRENFLMQASEWK
ncbi:MAG: ATP-binding protein [Ignavibacteriaceae bacterium]|nr:ATP-binding protein [Ignavibacteriaceae bacterium]